VDMVMGNAANVVLTSGAVQIVSSGGIAGGTIVESGAVESAVRGGQAYSEIISSGGIVIASGAARWRATWWSTAATSSSSPAPSLLRM